MAFLLFSYIIEILLDNKPMGLYTEGLIHRYLVLSSKWWAYTRWGLYTGGGGYFQNFTVFPTELKEAGNLGCFKTRIKNWKVENCPCRLCRIFVGGLGFL